MYKVFLIIISVIFCIYQQEVGSNHDIRFYINGLCKSSHFSFNKQLLKEIILIREYIKIIVIK